MAKNTTKVWRVQNQFGCGPYNGPGNILESLKILHGNMPKRGYGRPTLKQDRTRTEIFSTAALRNWVYGFSNLKQYHRWFQNDEVRNLLHHAGYYLMRFDVPKGSVFKTGLQAAFAREASRPDALRDCHRPGISRIDQTGEPDQLSAKKAQVYLNLTPTRRQSLIRNAQSLLR